MAKKKIVMAFGAFDILHPGHVSYLTQAKSEGTYLIVVVGRDWSIAKIKKRKPVFNENERQSLIQSLGVVDKAVLGSNIKSVDSGYLMIKKYKPDVLVFGYDQHVNIDHLKAWLKENKMDAKIVRAKPFGKQKSSIIRKKLGL